MENVITGNWCSENVSLLVESIASVDLRHRPINDSATGHRLIPLHVEVDNRLFHIGNSNRGGNSYFFFLKNKTVERLSVLVDQLNNIYPGLVY